MGLPSHRQAQRIRAKEAGNLTRHQPDILLGSFPEATKGITSSHVFSLMMTVEEMALKSNVSIFGHCTDSAAKVNNTKQLPHKVRN